MALESIADFCGELNTPGVRMVEYLPTAWVDSANYEQIVNAYRNWQYDIPLLGGATWLKAPIINSGKLWDERPRPNAQGTAYEQSVSGITPKMKPAVTDQFEQMDGYTFLLRITDRTNQVWILGTLDHPFTFAAPSTTGSGNARNQYSLNFSATTPRRAYGFVPEF